MLFYERVDLISGDATAGSDDSVDAASAAMESMSLGEQQQPSSSAAAAATAGGGITDQSDASSTQPSDVLSRASALVDQGKRVFKGDVPYNIAHEIFRSNVKFVHESHVYVRPFLSRLA